MNGGGENSNGMSRYAVAWSCRQMFSFNSWFVLPVFDSRFELAGASWLLRIPDFRIFLDGNRNGRKILLAAIIGGLGANYV
jgi:hypothetical protein